jgi:hypothetical protein
LNKGSFQTIAENQHRNITAPKDLILFRYPGAGFFSQSKAREGAKRTYPDSRKAKGFVGRAAMTQRPETCRERQVENREVHGDERQLKLVGKKR